MKIWGVALLVAFFGRYIVWWMLGFILYRLPEGVLNILFAVPYLLTAIIFFGLAAAVAAILYSQGVFREGVAASRSASGARPLGGGAGSITLTGDGGTTEALLAEIISNKRHCTGDLYLGEGLLTFICLKDQSIVSANAGRAVGQQFGLIGALIGALVSNAGKGKRDAEILAAREEAAAVDLAQRINLSDFSFSLTPNDIDLVKDSAWKGAFIEAHGVKYVFNQGMPADIKAALQQWCVHHEVANEGL